MAKKPGFRPYIILAALFAATGALLAFTVDVRISDVAGIRESLPTDLSDTWVGQDPLFCQDPTCGRSWIQQNLTPNEDGEYTCPVTFRGEPCGGELKGVSLPEQLNLPGDTVIFKKRYAHLQDPTRQVSATVVLSGKDRSSIHRPEVCMPSQGNTIVNREVISVPLENREPLEVMVLNLTRTFNDQSTFTSYYAYWFVGNDRETARHWERMLWMSTDRIFKNISHRWAYVALFGTRDKDLTNRSHYDEIREVVQQMYPQMTLIDSPE